MRTRSLVTAFAALVAASAFAALVSAQATNPRLGKWKLKQDPPALNIMTYEPFGNGGMRVTVESTNAQGRTAKWTYTTMFDGKDEPVSGDTRTETTAVTRVDNRTNEITNKRGGKVVQVITNVLSADGKTINNTYKNYNEQGELTNTTTAVYEKMP
jgi:carboxypeptidase C (cathepsin A)